MSQIDSILRVKLTRYWESNWLYIESQIDSILRVKLTLHWESNWLDIESQIDSIFRVKLTRYSESNWLDIASQIDSILRTKWTQYWEPKWLDTESQNNSSFRVKLTRYWELNWLDIESQIDSILRVKLTRYWESIRLKYSPITPGRILVSPVTQLFRSNDFICFFQYIIEVYLFPAYDAENKTNICQLSNMKLNKNGLEFMRCLDSFSFAILNANTTHNSTEK